MICVWVYVCVCGRERERDGENECVRGCVRVRVCKWRTLTKFLQEATHELRVTSENLSKSTVAQKQQHKLVVRWRITVDEMTCEMKVQSQEMADLNLDIESKAVQISDLEAQLWQSVCVCVCVCVRVRKSVRARARERERMVVCVCVRVRARRCRFRSSKLSCGSRCVCVCV